MIQRESRNNLNKRARIPESNIKKFRAPRNACDPLQIPDQQYIATDLNMQMQGVKTPSECVRIKGKVHLHITCDQIKKIYTEIRNDMNKVNKQ